jgi:hypothetical protein
MSENKKENPKLELLTVIIITSSLVIYKFVNQTNTDLLINTTINIATGIFGMITIILVSVFSLKAFFEQKENFLTKNHVRIPLIILGALCIIIPGLNLDYLTITSAKIISKINLNNTMIALILISFFLTTVLIINQRKKDKALIEKNITQQLTIKFSQPCEVSIAEAKIRQFTEENPRLARKYRRKILETLTILGQKERELKLAWKKKIIISPQLEEKQEKETEPRNEINIKINLEKKVHPGKSLTLDEKNYLINHGFKIGRFVKIGKKGPEEFLVKESPPESISHTFLVENIKLELEKYTNKIEINLTEKPDLIFKNRKGETIAIEVETGKAFKKNPEKIINKFDNVRAKYNKNAVIVLTDATKKHLYNEISKTVHVILRSEVTSYIQSQFKASK